LTCFLYPKLCLKRLEEEDGGEGRWAHGRVLRPALYFGSPVHFLSAHLPFPTAPLDLLKVIGKNQPVHYTPRIPAHTPLTILFFFNINEVFYEYVPDNAT
jgi:hypothetical protein